VASGSGPVKKVFSSEAPRKTLPIASLETKKRRPAAVAIGVFLEAVRHHKGRFGGNDPPVSG